MIVCAMHWWDDHQIALYLAAIAAGAVGLAAPAAPALERSIEPALALLLFATFLGVPMVDVGRAFRDLRFMVTLLVANFVVVPIVVFGLPLAVAATRVCCSGSCWCCSLRASMT